MNDVGQAVRDPHRLAALRRLVLLDNGATEAFDRIVRLAARVLHTQIALVTLIDADRQYFKASFGLPEPLAALRETPLSYSVCQYAVAMGGPLVICDVRSEHWLDGNAAVEVLGARSYAGMPLVTPDGYAVGTLCVIDSTPREWTDDELATLEDLASVVMREIRLHRLERRAVRQRDRRSLTD